MPFPGLVIEAAPPPGAGLSSRADIALFVGLVGRRRSPVPAAVRTVLERSGWAGAGPFARKPEHVEALLDVPVPIESWDQFDALFDWDGRAVEPGDPRHIPCPLGLAVRSFFAEGGVRAWVVRVGDSVPLRDRSLDDAQLLARRREVISWSSGAAPDDADERVPLIPGFGGLGQPADPHDPATWRGVAHAWGIEDAAMLLVPDLPELMAGPPLPAPALTVPPPPPEHFKPCAPPAPGVEPRQRAARLALAAPRLDRDRAAGWAAAIRALLDLLAMPRGPAHRRDLMLVASLPLPAPGFDDEVIVEPGAPLAFLDTVALDGGGAALNRAGIGSARLQLAYPWIATDASAEMPESVEGAEGVLAGALARTALARGAFRSAAGSTLASVARTLPALGSGDLRRGLPGGGADWMGDRLSLIGLKTGQYQLLSDATMAADRAWRPGGVSRLVGIILRAARGLGQGLIFEASGENLWVRLRREVEGLMDRLQAAGAFSAAGEDEAYTVRCDRSTMTGNDIANGRVIAEITFVAAQPIERIHVSLALTGASSHSTREVA